MKTSRIAVLGAMALLIVSASALSAAAGGPDTFGYEFRDEAETNGPTYSYQDISGTGTSLGLSGADDNAATLTLSQAFDFYGTAHTDLRVATNGYISTLTSDGGGDLSNDTPLPATPSSGGGARMYPNHDDLVVDATGEVYHQFFATSPLNNINGGTEPCTIIQWVNMRRFGGTVVPGEGFQVILFHTSGEIRFQYTGVSALDGSQATIGIQNDGATIGLEYGANTAALVNSSRAISFFVPSAAGDPEIDVQRTGSIASGGTDDLGSTVAPATDTYTYTIENQGATNPLVLNGSPLVAVSGETNCTATVTSQPTSPVAAGNGTTTFDVDVTTNASGAYSFVLTIENDDADEGTYVINVEGIAAGPQEIEILDPNSDSITSGATLNIYAAEAGSASSGTFTINNLGGVDLNLTGTPTVAESAEVNCSAVVSTLPTSPIAASGNDTFVVDVTPTAAGTFSFTLTIENNDADEGTFTINFTGEAKTTAEAEIAVWDFNDANISSGGTVSETNTGTALFSRAFTIRNEGGLTLNLTGTTEVAVSGENNCVVAITQPASNSLAAAGTWLATEEVFSLAITPSASGAFSFTVTIESNDTDEGTFTFTYSGNTASGGGGGGGGGSDGGGGCAASTNGFNWLALLGLLSVVAIAARVRGAKS